LAAHYNCWEGILLSSFGVAVEGGLEAVWGEDNVQVAVGLGVPCLLGVWHQEDGPEAHHHSRTVDVGPDSRMECCSDSRNLDRDNHYYYLGVRKGVRRLAFSCRNVHQEEVGFPEVPHNKDAVLVEAREAGLLCYCTSCVAEDPWEADEGNCQEVVLVQLPEGEVLLEKVAEVR
jgi:hypothetical protein